MKIEMGKLYKTRDGNKVRILATDLKRNCYPIIAAVTHIDEYGKEYEISRCYHVAGSFYDDGTDHRLDIVSEWREPIVVEGWTNVYSPDPPFIYNILHRTREEADKQAREDRIACIKVRGVESET